MTTDQANFASIIRVKSDIAQLRQGSSKIHVYYNSLKKLWDELSALQVSDIKDNNIERVNQFLMGIDESYSNIRDNILATKTLPSVESAYFIIESEETDRFIQTCKKNAAEYLGERRRNPYAGSGSVSAGGRYRDHDFGSRYGQLFASSYGSGGF